MPNRDFEHLTSYRAASQKAFEPSTGAGTVNPRAVLILQRPRPATEGMLKRNPIIGARKPRDCLQPGLFAKAESASHKFSDAVGVATNRDHMHAFRFALGVLWISGQKTCIRSGSRSGWATIESSYINPFSAGGKKKSKRHPAMATKGHLDGRQPQRTYVWAVRCEARTVHI